MQQSIDTYNFKGKKAIARVDFNVPLNEQFQITDDTRIRAAVPTAIETRLITHATTTNNNIS